MSRKEEALLQLTHKRAQDKAGRDRKRRTDRKDRDGGKEEGEHRGKEAWRWARSHMTEESQGCVEMTTVTLALHQALLWCWFNLFSPGWWGRSHRHPLQRQQEGEEMATAQRFTVYVTCRRCNNLRHGHLLPECVCLWLYWLSYCPKGRRCWHNLLFDIYKFLLL